MLFQALAKHVKRRQIVPKTVRMSRRVNGWQTKQYSICNVWKLSLHVYSKHNIVSLHDRKQLQDRQKVSYIHIQLAYPRHMIHAYKYNEATLQENTITCHHYSWTSTEESTKLHKPVSVILGKSQKTRQNLLLQSVTTITLTPGGIQKSFSSY